MNNQSGVIHVEPLERTVEADLVPFPGCKVSRMFKMTNDEDSTRSPGWASCSREWTTKDFHKCASFTTARTTCTSILLLRCGTEIATQPPPTSSEHFA